MVRDAFMAEDVLDDISDRAHAVYTSRLRDLLEPAHNGEFVAIHIDSADYAVDSSSSRARFALRARHPEGMIATTKIGSLADDSLAYRILASQLLTEHQK